MPPHTFHPSARLLYAFTALVAVAVIGTVAFADAGQPEAQCKGNSPKKVCPNVLPADGTTVSGVVTVSAQLEETVASMAFAVDDVALDLPDTAVPYETRWDTTKASNGTHVLKVTAVDATGKSSVREHRVDVSNATTPPPPPADTAAPSVALTSPAAGATVSGSVSAAADASDNVGVVGVQFKVDGADIGAEDTSAPYSVSWPSGNVPNGSHTITAFARDAAGNTATSQRTVTVSNTTSPPPPPGDTTDPTVGLTTPAAGATVSGSVAIAANASDNVGVVGVQFKIDGGNLGAEDTSAPYSVSWPSGNVPNGSHTITAFARDAAGNTATSQRTVTVSNTTSPPPPPGDTTDPTVGLTTPAAGATVSGSVAIAANASDNVGVVGVQFKIDGGNLGAEDTSAPYSVSWPSGNVPNGSHTITAFARDAAGNTATSQRTVTVSNTTSPPPPPGDTTDPTVGLTTPAAGATVSGSVAIAANASDNVGVVGVQFKIDGGNLGAEDTSAPYSVSWPSGNVPNGSHTITAFARDAAGNTATSQRTVTVSNDATDPTVGLTTPAAGATVSGSVTIAANASDNVGVVGVQFKIDGGNLGAEDTSAPYSVSWSSGNVPNGGHNITAFARDAAGNTATSQRTVTVSNSSGSPTGPKLSWAPPALSSPVTINVTNANKQLYLDKTKDYVLNITEKLVGRPGLWIEGGRNVRVVGGHIEMNTAGDSAYWDRTGVKVRYSTGVVHLEGLLIDGAYLADGIVTAAPDATLQIQNVRVERVHATGAEHADCLQTQGGLGALRIDRFSCTTQLQGIFMKIESGLRVGPTDIRNVNIAGAGGKYLFWQETTSVGPIALSNVWIKGNDPSWADFGMWVWPNKNAEAQSDSTRRAVVSSDGSYLTFQNSNISGRINKGVPPNGDFTPRSVVGLSYTSPGYG